LLVSLGLVSFVRKICRWLVSLLIVSCMCVWVEKQQIKEDYIYPFGPLVFTPYTFSHELTDYNCFILEVSVSIVRKLYVCNEEMYRH